MLALENKASMPSEAVDLPIGLSATDRYVEALRRAGGRPDVPREVALGALAASWISSATCSNTSTGRRVALWGDPDQLVSLVEFCVDMGMRPRYVVTGTPSKTLREAPRDEASPVAARTCGSRVARRRTCSSCISGSSRRRSTSSSAELTASTWPATKTFRSCGMASRSSTASAISTSRPLAIVGGMRLVEQILRAFLDQKDATCPEESFELVM